MAKRKHEEDVGGEDSEYGTKIDLAKTAKVALAGISVLLFLYGVFPLLPDANPSWIDRVKTILLFFVMSYGFGYTLLAPVKKPEDAVEKHVMTFAVGLGALPILTLILNTLHMPLDATLLLVLSLLYPAYVTLAKGKKIALSTKPLAKALDSKEAIPLLLVVFFASLYLLVLLKGSLILPYLEDDDSWDHAIGAKYISVMKTYSLPPGVPVTHYLEPYPPTYDGLMGILHQYNTSVQWTLKFFNALLISLSVVMAYYFIRRFTGDERIAVGGSFILTVAPCYLSHFIWAHTLGHVLFYPALYATEMMNKDKKWMLPAVLAVGSTLVTQPMVALVFGLFYLLYYLTRVAVERKLVKNVLLVGVLGLLVAIAFFWGQMVLKYGTGFEKIDGVGNRVKSGEFKIAFETRTIPFEEILLVQAYQGSPPDYCAALLPGYCMPLSGNIAIQKGFGVVLFILFIMSAFLLVLTYRRHIKPESQTSPAADGTAYWLPVSLVWAVFTMVGLESWALPFSVDPPRFFMFMTLPMAVLVPAGVLALADLLKKHVKPGHLILVLVLAVLYTSAYPKYVVQTAMWPYGVMWLNPEHVKGYVSLKTALPPEASVFPMCMSDSSVIGMDKLSLAWDKDVLALRERVLDASPQEMHQLLKNKGYEYAILDVSCIQKCNKTGMSVDDCITKVNTVAQNMAQSGLYAPATGWDNSAVLLYKLK